ncbi:hypothetical protein GE09DRAFT_1196390 [Coniochaeta sp. 2T2.1]|nr:hypothetical protein GE09DRAFT_1196390 [Coniochaeta sp. 2T2.1]
MATTDAYPHLRLDKEIYPLLYRYGLSFKSNVGKSKLCDILSVSDVPLDRIEPVPQGSKAVRKDQIRELGLDQVIIDFPPDSEQKYCPTVASLTGTGTGSNDSESDPAPTPTPVLTSAQTPAPTSAQTPTPAPASTAPAEAQGHASGSNSRVITRSRIRLKETIPTAQELETIAISKGLPPQDNNSNPVPETEIRLLTDYPIAKQCIPNLAKAFEEDDVRVKATTLVQWFSSRARFANLSVPEALAFLDSYIIEDKLSDPVAYLLNEGDLQKSWFNLVPNTEARRLAAKRMSNLWNMALTPSGATAEPGVRADVGEHFMQFIDPYDDKKTSAQIIGKHMSKKNVLAVRAPSLSIQFPDLGRGYWVECKQGPEMEYYNKYVATGPNRKLESADPLLLSNCTSPDHFDLDCVFTMKWGNTYHWYGYGRPKNETNLPKMMFSRSNLAKAWKGASTTMKALEQHLRKVGQDIPLAGSTSQLDQITLRSKRIVEGEVEQLAHVAAAEEEL